MTVASHAHCARTAGVMGFLAAGAMALAAPPPGQPAPPTNTATATTTPITHTTPTATPARPGADKLRQRTVQLFAFDEQDNPDPVPPHWRRAQDNPHGGPDGSPGFSRPGFPGHNLAELDRDVKRSGIASVRVPTRGGSAGLRLEAGQVAVFADADYVVEAWVKTSDLRHARAFVVVRMLDQRLEPIQGAEARSRPLISAGGWTPVSLTLPGKFRDAAWLQIDLEVLQPRAFEGEPTGPAAGHKVWREDVAGAAWFDDVGVYQIPRATLRTNAPSNIVTGPARPELTMAVRDLAGDPLSANVTVTDVDGRVVATHSTMLDPGARPTTWAPELPSPSYGWYRAAMEVGADNTPVSHAEVWFLHLPERPSGTKLSADSRRFGIAAEHMSEARMRELPELLESAGAGLVIIPAFDADAPSERIEALTEARGPLYDTLLSRGLEITLSVPRLPRPIAAMLTIDPDDPLALAERDPEGTSGWLAYLTPTLDVYGQRMLRYQVGAVGSTQAMRRDSSRGLTAFEAAIARLVPAPVLALPWGADSSPPRVARSQLAPGPGKSSREDPVFATLSSASVAGPLVDAVTLTYPAGFPAEGLLALAAEWKDRAVDLAFAGVPAEVTIVPELPDPGRFGRRAGVIELTRRAVWFWRALGASGDDAAALARPARFAVREPWRFDTGRGGSAGGIEREDAAATWPGPELGVLRIVSEHLAGRRVIGEMPAAPGVRAFILAGVDAARKTLDRGCVVAWNESAIPGDAKLDLAAAGNALTIVDPFGNERVVNLEGEARVSAAGPLVSVSVGQTPEFIEGVDPYLAMFAAQLRLEPSFIPAVVEEHEHRLVLTNPWPVRISGQLQLKEAVTDGSQGRGWNITPRGVVEFVIAPGETTFIPVTLTFGAGQLAGPKDFVVLAKVLADRQYPPLRLKTRVEVGLPNLELRPEVQVGPGADGPDVYVVAGVTNRDARPRTLRLETAARGVPGQQLQISDLPPGQTIYRRFVFKNGAAAMSGRRIVLSLSDVEAAERLNKAVVVP